VYVQDKKKKQCEISRPSQKRRVVLKYVCFVPSSTFSVSSRKLLVLPFDYHLHLDWLPEGESLARGDGAIWLESLADLAESNGIYIKTISSVSDKCERHPFHLTF